MKKKRKKAKLQKVSVEQYWQTISDIVLSKLTNHKKVSDRVDYMKAMIKLIKKTNNIYHIIPIMMLNCFEMKHGSKGYKMSSTQIANELKIPKNIASYYANAAPCILSKFHWDMGKYHHLHQLVVEIIQKEKNHG